MNHWRRYRFEALKSALQGWAHHEKVRLRTQHRKKVIIEQEQTIQAMKHSTEEMEKFGKVVAERSVEVRAVQAHKKARIDKTVEIVSRRNLG